MTVKPDLRALRDALVADLRARDVLHDAAVADALATVPRHLFLPGVPPAEAYVDEAVVTRRDAEGTATSSSSQPAIMAIMLEQLDVRPGHRVLEIGAGTGYNAALLAHLVGPAGSVTTIDLQPDVADAALAALAAAGYGQVRVVCGDGALGVPDGAPYDRMIVTAGAWDLPPAWFEQLAVDGRLVVPFDLRGVMRSIAFERLGPDGSAGGPAGPRWRSRSAHTCGFMPLRGLAAGPGRRLRIGEGDAGVSLSVDGEREIDADRLAAALTAPPVEFATGLDLTTPQLVDGLFCWLALTEPDSCGLHAGAEAVERGPVEFPVVYGGPSGPSAAIGSGLVAGASAALLARPRTEDRSAVAPLVVRGYGVDGSALATRLVAAARAWHDAGRPGSADMRVEVLPLPEGAGDGADDTGAYDGRYVVDKRYVRVLVSWPRTAASSRCR
ncbi:methyltransferase, FxLD system [Actinopolymorpha singaporensis]|uniref:Protein-L-isoaspartate O-methyltransferase n=1 Tax=Actinopolymorpha singaporensis TaxID=117157 RepID=A0A1H1PSG3_9ACTN|nr:methyltransferase, FxLD system [Actinopolymorpha singaporensis]SDS14064.1 protein-L-isoaspartate(D-aspartate) O-methyltransferase [Actinopolymorpha singaporensis]